MKRLLCALWLGAGLLQAQTSPLTFYVHDTRGVAPDTPLSSSYAFANTPAGSSTSIVIKAVNSSANTIYWVNAFLADSASSFVTNNNFSITGQFVNTRLRRQASFSLPSTSRPPRSEPRQGIYEPPIRFSKALAALRAEAIHAPAALLPRQRSPARAQIRNWY